MLIEILSYYTPDIPTVEDVEMCVHITQEKHCIVHLFWTVLNLGIYDCYIDDSETVQEALSRIPSVYPV